MTNNHNHIANRYPGRTVARVQWLVLSLILLLASACSGPKSFKVQGQIEGLTNTTLYFRYYSDYTAYNTPCIVRDGKFEAELPAPDPAMVEIQDNSGNVLARFYAKNGDDITIKILKDNPFANTITGTEINERWAKTMSDNSQTLKANDPDEVNAAIEDYVRHNPDDVVSTLMFVAFYDFSKEPVRADSVLSTINPDAREANILNAYYTQMQRFINIQAYAPIKPFRYRPNDTIDSKMFDPRDKEVSLIVVSNENNRYTDSIAARIRKIYKDVPKKKVQIIDFALYQDTTVWRRTVARDSAEWIQGWLPGGILADGLNQLAIPAIPYYIVTDSVGSQIYRGQSADSAKTKINEIINR